VINKSTISISDTENYTPYERNGTIKLVKTPITVKFNQFQDLLTVKKDLAFDELLVTSDFMKLDNPIFSHIAFLSITSANYIDHGLKLARDYFTEEDLKTK
jgi:hypothetical protein